jgi:hypothetical protein
MLALELILTGCSHISVPAPRHEQYSSTSGRFLFAISLDMRPGYTVGTLRSTSGHEVMWSRPLANNFAPEHVLVGNSGGKVVTLGERHRSDVGGASGIPVVEYGGLGGEVWSVYSVWSIKRAAFGNDVNELPQSWLRNSLALFDKAERGVFVRLDSGQTLYLLGGGVYNLNVDVTRIVELKRVALEATEMIHARTQKLLKSRDPSEICLGAMIAGQDRFVEALPALHSLLTELQIAEALGGNEATGSVKAVQDAARQAIRLIAGD